MGVPVLILGESGSGKSASLRNFEPEEIGVFNVAGKPLPFRKKLQSVNTADYEYIKRIIHKSDKKAFVIDDSQYLMCFESFARAKDTGFGKFTDFALHFYNLALNRLVLVFLCNIEAIFFWVVHNGLECHSPVYISCSLKRELHVIIV